MIKFTYKGDYSKLKKYMNNILEIGKMDTFNKYGREGVEALREYTPKDTGLTANSWYYEIIKENDRISIVFNNSNINKNVNIAMILQYGHGTGTGGWVEGTDYINPALEPIFKNMVNDLWEEVVGK